MSEGEHCLDHGGLSGRDGVVPGDTRGLSCHEYVRVNKGQGSHSEKAEGSGAQTVNS